MVAKLWNFIILISLLVVGVANAAEKDTFWKFVPSDSLLSSNITVLYQAGQVLYVGTETGMNWIQGDQIRRFGPFIGLPYDSIGDIAAGGGRLWCIAGGKVYVLRQGYWFECVLEGLDVLEGGRAMCLEMGVSDMMIATNRGRIYAVNTKEPLVLNTPPIQDTTVLDSILRIPDSTAIDSVLRSLTWVRVTEWKNLRSGDAVVDIAHWKWGIYYLATPSGFWRFHSEKKDPESIFKKAGEDVASGRPGGVCVESESDSTVWIAGAYLIGKINPTVSDVKAETLRIRGVKDIAVDSSGHRWCLATDTLFEIYPDSLAFVKHPLPDSFRGYRLNTILAIPGDTLLLGTSQGLFAFKPGRPPVTIKSIELIQERDTATNDVLIYLGTNNAVAYPYIECQWSIDEGEWFDKTLPSINDNLLNLGNLEGKIEYTVAIKIRRPLVEADFVDTTFPFEAPPKWVGKAPFYKCGWFIAVAVIFLVIVAVVLFFIIRRKQRINKLKAKKAGLKNPYISGSPIIEEEKFIGRQKILNEVLAGVHDNSFLIFGEQRIGKTSLLFQIRNRVRAFEDKEYKVESVMVNLQTLPERRTAKTFYTLLARTIAKAIYSKRKLYDTEIEKEKFDFGQFELFIEDVSEYMRRRNRKKEVRVVLLIDEGDIMAEFGPGFQSQFRGLFVSSIAGYFNIVLMLREFSPEWRLKTSPWYNFFNVEQLKPMSKEEAFTLVQKYVEEAVKFKKQALNRIWEITQGHPYEIQKLCSKIYNSLGDKVFVSSIDVIRAMKTQE